MRPAHVVAVETLSAHFRLVDLEGEAIKDIAWSAGQKIQVAMGTGLTTRTYTPMSWNAQHGMMRLLTFAHGEGPGSQWAKGLQSGDTCQFLGPRRSLDLSGLVAPAVLFGDETSFGLAAALRDASQGPIATCLFEVSDAAEAGRGLEAIGLGEATVIERLPEDMHIGAAEAALSRLAGGGTPFILTGKASSIQRVRRALKAAGVGSSRIKVKAYWAPGKTGLD
jgi:NADPH-dependent ferric siderophore reductase